VANAYRRAGSPIGRTVASLLLAATLLSCASAPDQSARVIATLAPGVGITDQKAFERLVLERTSVHVAIVAPISERMYALSVQCEPADAGCAHARQRLLGSGLFAAIVDDRRRSGR
jgi:hypothetical protein